MPEICLKNVSLLYKIGIILDLRDAIFYTTSNISVMLSCPHLCCVVEKCYYDLY